MFNDYSFEVAYLLSTLLMMYSIFRLLDRFYESSVRDGKRIWPYFVVYYVLITSIFLTFRVPALTMTTNITMIFLIATRYDRSVKKALMAVVFTFIIMVLAEAILGFLILPQFGQVDMTSAIIIQSPGIVITTYLLQFVLIMGIIHFVDFKAQDITISYWFALLILPVVSIYIMMVLFQASLARDYQYTLISVLLLIANFLVFFLYGVLSKFTDIQHREASLLQQNEMYARQYDMMRRSEEALRGFRHDHNHHMAVMKGLADTGCSEELKDYLAGMENGGIIKEVIINTGNIVIDSIVNYHLTGLEREGVEVHCDVAMLPRSMEIEKFDMTSILSNLLANAVEAVSAADRKVVALRMGYEKGIFFINVENTFSGIVEKSGDGYKTIKEGKNHGIGIANIRRALDKYDGRLELHHDEEWFRAEAMLYLRTT